MSFVVLVLASRQWLRTIGRVNPSMRRKMENMCSKLIYIADQRIAAYLA